MATIAGKNGIIKAITSTGTPAAIGEVKSFNINGTAETADDTALGDSWRTHKLTLKAWEVTLEAHYDPADNAQADLVLGASVDLELLPSGSGTPLAGTGTVTSRSIPVELEGIVSHSVTIQGNGAMTGL
jgi:hypothetical protein